MFIAKLFIGVLLITMANCSSSGNNKDTNTLELKEVCRCFAKAICTKDTIRFYKLVDEESLTTSMNGWINDGKKLTHVDLFFPFFFVYSPLKIRYQDLIDERNKEKFFADFIVEHEEMVDESNAKLNLVWRRNLSGAELQMIELHLKKSNEWKVTGAKWKAL